MLAGSSLFCASFCTVPPAGVAAAQCVPLFFVSAAVSSCRPMASSSAAAAAPEALPGAPGTADTAARPAGGRRKQGKIDYDNNIARKKVEMQELSRELKRTKADSRNEKRKKQRLVRKAAQLTIVDLHRIAALKKAGIWDPALGLSDVPWGAVDSAASAEVAEAVKPPPVAEISGPSNVTVATAETNQTATDAEAATSVAAPMAVDAADDGDDVEEDAP